MSQSEHLPIYLKIYQLIKFLYRIVNNFSKQYKYTLGEDILKLGWECLDLVLEINALPDNEKHLKILRLSIIFDKLKLRLRMIQELNLISEKQFSHIQNSFIKEIGQMIGGWLNWSK
jgi:hypothetical protein